MLSTCAFGHLYDSDQYASCPYCNRGVRAIVFSKDAHGNDPIPATTIGTPVGGVGQTTMGGDVGRTVAPGFEVNQPDNIGKTTMPDYMVEKMNQEKINHTIGIFEKKYGLNPVVGWLVCVEGAEKGKDYRLMDRINTIGRGEDNDVVLKGEQTISMKNHARIAYDRKHNNFQIIPGEGHNIIYLNDAPIYMPQRLNSHDVIEFGDMKLIFVPLCTDKFQWQQED